MNFSKQIISLVIILGSVFLSACSDNKNIDISDEDHIDSPNMAIQVENAADKTKIAEESNIQPTTNTPDDGIDVIILNTDEISLTIKHPYGCIKSKESVDGRGGSITSYFLDCYKGGVFLDEIGIFSSNSISKFIKDCEEFIRDHGNDFCFEGFYPDLEYYNKLKNIYMRAIETDKFSVKKINDQIYLVKTFHEASEKIMKREYTTFIDDIMIVYSTYWYVFTETADLSHKADELLEEFTII